MKTGSSDVGLPYLLFYSDITKMEFSSITELFTYIKKKKPASGLHHPLPEHIHL